MSRRSGTFRHMIYIHNLVQLVIYFTLFDEVAGLQSNSCVEALETLGHKCNSMEDTERCHFHAGNKLDRFCLAECLHAATCHVKFIDEMPEFAVIKWVDTAIWEIVLRDPYRCIINMVLKVYVIASYKNR
ncbi:hypothetical protein ACJX0J_007396, partial [Zea mays]